MKIAIILCVLCFQWRPSSTEETQNKTKRGLLHQTHYLTSFRPVGVYAEPAPASTQPQGLSHYYSPKIAPKPIYEPEPKVAAQQVVYEYQQTPTNTVSNVHFNQHLIPQAQPEQQVAYSQFLSQPSNNNYPQIHQEPFTPAEAVVNPVQHSSLIQHTPYIATPTQVPQTPQNPYLLGKYVYLNGKVMYNANPHLQHPLAKPLPQKQPYQKLTPPGPLSPINFQNYQQQLPKITPTTVKPVVKQEIKKVKEEEDEKADVREEEEDDEDERENYREEEDDEDEEDRPKYRNREESYGRYTFDDDDDDDDDHQNYKEEDDDDDNDNDNHRGSTKYYTKKQPKHYSTSYKYKEGYKKESKSHKPHRPIKTKESYKYGKNPKKFDSQGKPSQNVPVTVKKVYKEKWYITRDSNPHQ